MFIFDYPDSCEECKLVGVCSKTNNDKYPGRCPIIEISSGDIFRAEMFLNRIRSEKEL